jgi:hypothetical protein
VSMFISAEEAAHRVRAVRGEVLAALQRPTLNVDLRPDECQLFCEKAHRSEEWMMRHCPPPFTEAGKARFDEIVAEVHQGCFDRLLDALTAAMLFGVKCSTPDAMHGGFHHCQERLPLGDDFVLPAGKRIHVEVMRFDNISGELDIFHGCCFGWLLRLECRWSLEDAP